MIFIYKSYTFHWKIVLVVLFTFFYIHENIFAETIQNKQNTEFIELIKNGNFDAGLDNWRVKPNEINCKTDVFKIESCDKQAEYMYGFPKSSVSDALSVEERYFVTQVPSYSEKGWFDSTWQVVTASALEQDIDLPTAKNISLSFKARGYSDTQIEIYVKNIDDGTRTLINQLIINTARYSLGDYIHRTYDMTSFAGKKITLIFVSKQITIPEVGAEDFKTSVYLDDISLKAEVIKKESSKNIEPFKIDLSGILIIIIIILSIFLITLIIKIKRLPFVKSQQKQSESGTKSTNRMEGIMLGIITGIISSLIVLIIQKFFLP